MSNYGTDGLATISHDDVVPECRMKDAQSTQDFCRRLIDNDQKRSYKRSRVNGMVDGNPPYRRGALLAAGRADACNANWGTGRSYMESGTGAFYDLTAEAPGFVGIRTSHGNEEQQEQYSRVMMEEADRMFAEDPIWDYEMQQSQNNMVLHGIGPFMFQDPFSVFPKAYQCGDLKVPEFTKSDTRYWDAGMVEDELYPPQLFEFIDDAEAATRMGWDVEHTRRVIEHAMDFRTKPGIQYTWEFYQQELKNNSLAYYDDSKVCWICHVYWKEFSGRITHAIVERDTSDGCETKYLFIAQGKYATWDEAIHPMYFDRGNGGKHHSVTGLGVKMFSAMEYENRLLCNLMDKTFSPKILFKPTSTEATQRFQLAHHGDFGLLPNGYEAIQNPMVGLLNDGLAMYRASSEIMQSNLSSYRQQVPTKTEGNPVTAKQVSLEASQMSALSKTTFNRYYKQLDSLYAEIIRRACNLNSTDKRAIAFQKRCVDRGVPREAFGRVTRVEAMRVIGQGSQFMRRAAVDALMPFAGSLPEDGRDNLICDKIAAEAGQYAVSRYYKKPTSQQLPSDQQAEALQWVGLMKIGVPPVVTSSQNAVTYAATYITAASQALQSLQKGAKPEEVLAFLHICGPAILAQLKRFANDTLREKVFQEMLKQWKQIAAATDQLQEMVQKQQDKQKQQAEKQQQVMNDQQIKQAKAMSDMQIKQQKTAAQLKQSAEKHRMKMAHDQQNLAMKDATTASDIHRKNKLASFEMENASKEE